jgi:histidine ammonia-lyase
MDRASLAALGARRAMELHSLGRSIITVELIVAAQAIDLRNCKPLGASTARFYDFVRQVVPVAFGGNGMPNAANLLEHLDKHRDIIAEMTVLSASGSKA